MRIAIVTDAWYPQRNGVVRVLGTLRDTLATRGHEVLVISPDQFLNIPLPTYTEIRLALFSRRTVARRLDDFRPMPSIFPRKGRWGSRRDAIA